MNKLDRLITVWQDRKASAEENREKEVPGSPAWCSENARVETLDLAIRELRANLWGTA